MSPKPWAKLEVGYMRHQKFLALSGNAISLWHEGKDYCDTHHTDGIIPKAALRTFRFRAKASIDSLATSCGPKPDGTPFAPLWEVHPLGYRMHDYLDHNDCRDKVIARMEQAEENRAADRERLKRWRAGKKTKPETAFQPPFQKRDSNADETLLAETVTATTKQKRSAPPPGNAPHGVRDFLATYDRLFFDLHGQRPDIQGGRDGAIAKRTIAKFGEEKAGKLLELFFSSSDPFIQKSGYGLNIFSGQINKLLTEMGKSQAQAVGRSVWVCPHVDECQHRAMCEVKLANPAKYPVRPEQAAS